MRQQTAKSKMDEKLGMLHGKESKHKQTMPERRKESKAMSKTKKKGCM